jgi:hypothetical protein
MPALAGDASVDIGKLEGVYRKREQNGDSSGALSFGELRRARRL